MDQALAAKFSLDGRRAVVTGAASGIGRQAAITFAEAGASLVLADRDTEGLEAVRAALPAGAADVRLVPLDVRDRAAVEDLAQLAAGLGGADVWANVAGVISNFRVVEAVEDEVDRILGVNLKGVYWGCSAAARIMTARGSGSIINISSAGADAPGAGLSVYSMTKAAVNMLTRTLAVEVGPNGVRVNAVAPGYIDTPMITYRFRTADGGIDVAKREEIFAGRAANAALGRIGTPEDIALAMLYLASDASAFVTGQVLRPNGGSVMP